MSRDDNQEDSPAPILSWQLWVDGTALPNPGKISIGLVLTAPDGNSRLKGAALNLSGCNNEAELHALIAGLSLAREAGARRLQVRSDSDFVVRHVRGEMSTRVARLLPLIAQARQCLEAFETVELLWVPRHRNTQADALAREAQGLATTKKTNRPKA